MSDNPTSTPEISTHIPQIQDPNTENIQYTQNDTGSLPVEKEPSEGLSDFAFFLRNINEGFRKKVQNEMNADGVFLSTESEFNAVANWEKWNHHTSLPDILTQQDPETLKLTVRAFEDQLQQIKQGIPDQNGNQIYLNFNDYKLLTYYYKLKFPAQVSRIDEVIGNLEHDLLFIGGGINESFRPDKETREAFKDFRHASMLKWQQELIEMAAQDLTKEIVDEQFDPAEKAQEVKDVFDIISKNTNVHFDITIRADKNSTPTPHERMFYGNPAKFKRVIKNLWRYGQLYSKKHNGMRVEAKLELSKDPRGRLIVQSIDTSGGFTGTDKRLVEEFQTVDIPGRPGLKKQLAFVREERGSDSTGSGFGMDMVWNIVVNEYNGTAKIMNDATLVTDEVKQVHGARFVLILEPHKMPNLETSRSGGT